MDRCAAVAMAVIAAHYKRDHSNAVAYIPSVALYRIELLN